MTSIFAVGYLGHIIVDTTNDILNRSSWFGVRQGLGAVNVLSLMEGQAGMFIHVGKFAPEP